MTAGDFTPRFVPPRRSPTHVTTTREVFGCPSLLLKSFARSSAALRMSAFAAALFLWTAALGAQTVSPDQAADMLLTSAKTAYNEKDYPFAAGRFREFLGKFGNHKDAPAARYGLALSLIDGPDKDYNGAVEQLQNAGQRQGRSRLSVLRLLPRPGPARPGRQGAGPDPRQAERGAAAEGPGPRPLRRGGQAVRRRRRRLRRPRQDAGPRRQGTADRPGMGRPRPLRPGRDAAAAAASPRRPATP